MIRKETRAQEKLLGKEKESIMRRKAMMREMNMRRLAACIRSMPIFPCLIMSEDITRSGGSLMKG